MPSAVDSVMRHLRANLEATYGPREKQRPCYKNRTGLTRLQSRHQLHWMRATLPVSARAGLRTFSRKARLKAGAAR